MKPTLILTVVFAALAAAGAGAEPLEPSDAPQPYLIFIQGSFEDTYAEVLQIVEETGGAAPHRFPYEAVLVEVQPSVADELAALPDVVVYDGAVPGGEPGGPIQEAAALAWNVFFMGEPSPLTEPWSEDAPYYTDHETDAIVLDAADVNAAGLKPAKGPWGAGPTETSEFFCGSIAVAVFTMESNGSAENWTTAEIANVKAEIVQGLNNWIANEPNAGLSFTYVYHDRTATTSEPIQGPSTNDTVWMQEAMTSLGYNDPNVYTNLFNYADDLRNQQGTDWAYSVFVVDDTNDADKMFSNFWSAYAYLGGPATVMTYDNGTTGGVWGIARMDMVLSHETGHIFWALDEYFGSCTLCTASSGYLWVQNQNCNATGSGGCSIHQNCVMRNNNIANRCAYTRGQLGLTDTDADTIPDVRDTFPSTQLTAFSPNPTALTSLTYTGQATVSPLSRPGGTGNNISINTITGVSYRVGGSGAWYPAAASDGAFDGPQENYTFTVGPLGVGTYLVETRARNDVSNADATPATDTVQVVTGPAAGFTEDVTSGVAPLTVAFTDATTGHVTGWTWTFGDGGTSAQQNPEYQYAAVGTFTVSLVSAGGGVSSTATKNNLITVTCPGPVASFTASPTTGEVPLRVDFTDTSTAYAGCGVTSRQWDFGDGNGSSSLNPTHTYVEAGTYSVTLTVNSAGGSDSQTRDALVTVSPETDDDDDASDDDDSSGDDDEGDDDDANGDDDDDDDTGCGC